MFRSGMFSSILVLSLIFSSSVISCDDNSAGLNDVSSESATASVKTDDNAAAQGGNNEDVSADNVEVFAGRQDPAPQGSEPAGNDPRIIKIPDGMPFWEGSHMEIDLALLETFAKEYCRIYGTDADVLDFICGWLPLALADSFCPTSPDKVLMNKYMGAMYISGYFGGVWLRDVLFSNSSGTPADTLVEKIINAMMEKMPEVLRNVMNAGGEQVIFKNLALLVGTATYTAISGSKAEVITACGVNAAPFFTVYGYDYGYYYYLIDNPPEGVAPGEDPLVCNSFMDCRMESQELVTLNQYKPVLEDLLHPTPLYRCLTAECRRWVEMYEAKNVFGLGSVSLGNMVWDNIMSDNAMMESAYGPLVDLSARFMLVSELTLLPTVKGYAEFDETAGRCGLLQQAGMMTWLGSYVLGLSSSLPEGTFPELNCP